MRSLREHPPMRNLREHPPMRNLSEGSECLFREREKQLPVNYVNGGIIYLFVSARCVWLGFIYRGLPCSAQR